MKVGKTICGLFFAMSLFGLLTFVNNAILYADEPAGVIIKDLTSTTTLQPQGMNSKVAFKGGTALTMNKTTGTVVTGVLARDTSLNPSGMTTPVTFKANHSVTFNAEGKVVAGTLAQKTRLLKLGSSKPIMIPSGTVVHFNKKGEVK